MSKRRCSKTEGDFENMRSKKCRAQVYQRYNLGHITRVKVEDIAVIIFDYKTVSRIRMMGEPAIALPVYRETGANVIEVMRGIRSAVSDIGKTFGS